MNVSEVVEYLEMANNGRTFASNMKKDAQTAALKAVELGLAAKGSCLNPITHCLDTVFYTLKAAKMNRIIP